MKLGITLSTFPMQNSPVVFSDGLWQAQLVHHKRIWVTKV